MRPICKDSFWLERFSSCRTGRLLISACAKSHIFLNCYDLYPTHTYIDERLTYGASPAQTLLAEDDKLQLTS